VIGMTIAETAILLMSNAVGVLFLVLRRCIVPALALATGQNNQVSHVFSFVSGARGITDI
jgi:hypothetical protein